ncbi:MAG: ATP-binding protein [Gemmatimonadota bacterium]|nr:ATP-binding protein [Gemmatimonadota bacterium]
MTPTVAPTPRDMTMGRGLAHEWAVLAGTIVWGGLFAASRAWPARLQLAANIAYFFICIPTVWAMRRASGRARDAQTARAWWLLSWASVAMMAAGVLWTFVVIPRYGAVTPFWSYLADELYAPLAISAFLAFPGHPVGILRQRQVQLDAALLAVGTAALAWYFSFQPLLRGHEVSASWVQWGEAVVSWAVVLAACWGYLRARDLSSRLSIALLMLAQVLFNISGLVLAVGGEGYAAGDLVDVVFFGAWVFRWAAARTAFHQLAVGTATPVEGEYQSGIAPAGFVAGAFAVLVYVVFVDTAGIFGNPTGVAVVASAMTWLLVARHAAHLMTTRRQMQVVASQQERSRAIMDSFTDYVFLADAEGRIRWSSAPAHETFALEASAPFLLLVHTDDREAVTNWLPGEGRALSTQPVLARLRRADGEWAHAELRGSDLLDDETVGGLVINGRDRTSEVTLEGRVRHAEKLATLHDMAGRIAHAFNNVLAVVQGHAELLAADRALDAAWHDDVGDMRSAANRGAAITRQLLGFSGRQVVHAEAIDVSAVVGEVLPTWRRLLPSHTTVQLEGDLGAWRAFVDRAQLEQVLLNLVVNARDAMPNGGAIFITLARGEAGDGSRRVLVAVRDSGTGIDAEQQLRIFEPFFTTKEPGVGTGLGLAMVDTIVRRSGGEITLVSQPGKGSTFTVSLPAVASRASGSRAVVGEPSDPMPVVAQAAVLLVDDEDAVRNVSKRILMRAGFQVRACASGAEALEVAALLGAGIDVVVTDMMMPGMTGRELIDRLVVSYPALPIIIITGFTADVDTREPMPPQVQRIIEKPFEAAELIGAVRRAAASRAAQRTRT